MIQFLYHDRLMTETQCDPNMTVLHWLRRRQQQTGTKEGCASGDCGACTVALGRVVAGRIRYESANSCLLPISQLQGCQLLSVDSLKQSSQLHPVQQSLADCHASQCGFCTPGFVMSVFTLAKQEIAPDRHAINEALGGNLCRCTGYRPLVEAAIKVCAVPLNDTFLRNEQQTVQQLQALANPDVQSLNEAGHQLWLPKTVSQLAALYQANPQAQLIAGGTDLMLQVTQQFRALPALIALHQIAELQQCSQSDDHYIIGAAAPITDVAHFLQPMLPAFGRLLQRFASQQIRNLGTCGGNIANASPIGDIPPLLLALDAWLLVQQGEQLRRVALADFFLDYRKTQLRPGEFIRTIHIPKPAAMTQLRAWKVSKRQDDDISTVCGTFNAQFTEGVLRAPRVAFGGMAAIPKRAAGCEAALNGQPLNEQTLEVACAALTQDFQPLSDFRGSSAYRLAVAQNLLRRYFAALQDHSQPLEVSDDVA
ncbi:xanthine dehydrogenase small subunit [Enterobacterales bacterium CwR94]|nr:xanthine dehydrogenase small subunit [Enterobacterales bacterium CwR94]